MRVKNQQLINQKKRFAAYLDILSHNAGHADRVAPLQSYIKGLLLPIERKSVEPMAAQLAPDDVGRMHQSLHHIVAEAAWSDTVLLAAVRDRVLPTMTRRHRLAAWIVNDSGFPKKGTHSVGVARQQYCPTGRQENCRIAVSVSMATAVASLPVKFRLYLPETWAEDQARRQEAGVPEEIGFQTKPDIALDQLRMMVEEEVPRAPVVADAAFGADNRFRVGLESMGLTYCVEIQSPTSVWLPAPVLSLSRSGNRVGRPPKIGHGDALRPPFSAEELSSCLCEADLRRIAWREDARGTMYSRFARLRVRATSYRNKKHNEQWPERWLLVEWPQAERKPTKYWLSNLPEQINLQQLVTTAKMRWVAERDFEELKNALGLNHYEGRNWRGFHHHATLCLAAYGFLVLERHLAPIAGGGIAA